MTTQENIRREHFFNALYAVLLTAGIALLLLAACGEGLGGWLISDQDEIEIGRSVDQEIEAEYRMVADSDPVAIWAQTLVGRLEGASVDFRDPADIGGYKVEVIADNELVNAFAAPGGFTYISTGLILNATTCAEIAGVMGHELAHVTERHGVKNIEEAYGVQVISQWFLGEGLASDVAQTLHTFLMSTTYSQEHESESDEVGLQIAYLAGYNPYGLVDFFEKLLELSGGASVPQFLSSHPATEDRIASVDAKIRQLYPTEVRRGETQSYECLEAASLSEIQQRITSGQLTLR